MPATLSSGSRTRLPVSLPASKRLPVKQCSLRRGRIRNDLHRAIEYHRATRANIIPGPVSAGVCRRPARPREGCPVLLHLGNQGFDSGPRQRIVHVPQEYRLASCGVAEYEGKLNRVRSAEFRSRCLPGELVHEDIVVMRELRLRHANGGDTKQTVATDVQCDLSIAHPRPRLTILVPKRPTLVFGQIAQYGY